LLRDYEILFIVRPELDDEQLGVAVEGVNTLIGNLGGKSEGSNVWGKRRLAYEVAHLREGHYVLTDFKLEPARVPELEATLKISDTVFRHLVVRKPDPKKLARKPAAAAPATAPAVAPAAEPAAAPAAEEAVKEPVASEPAVAVEAAAAGEPTTEKEAEA